MSRDRQLNSALRNSGRKSAVSSLHDEDCLRGGDIVEGFRIQDGFESAFGMLNTVARIDVPPRSGICTAIQSMERLGHKILPSVTDLEKNDFHPSGCGRPSEESRISCGKCRCRTKSDRITQCLAIFVPFWQHTPHKYFLWGDISF